MADLRIYTDEELAFLRQLPDLPDELSLTPEQTSVVIGESLDWLRKKRQGSEASSSSNSSPFSSASISRSKIH